MQESEKQRIPGGSGRLYTQSMQEGFESYCWQQYHIPDHNSSLEKSGFRTLDSSSVHGSHAYYGCPSTEGIAYDGSPNSQPEPQSSSSDMHSHSPENAKGSPMNDSCITNDVDDLRHKLRELETVMLGPSSDILNSYGNSSKVESDSTSVELENWKRLVEMVSLRNLKEMLIVCAKAVSDNDLLTAEWLMSELRQMVSVSGEPIQRLGAYMLEGLVARLAASGSSIYRALRCKEPASAELLSYMHLLYDVCPYFKFGYMSANGAIAEAMKDENRIHIVDFQIAQGSQWFSLLQALAARPGGPPRIRITGIDDSTSAYARGGGLDIVRKRLSRLAESFNIPFEFHAATIGGSKAELEGVLLQPGEALAVNFPFMLHHMPDESVSTQNHRDGLLRLVKSLSPKVVTLIEQESNTNSTPFLPRFLETLDYYTAIFESIDVTLPREHKERISVEQHCLARDMVNIIACEGAARVERHEVLGKWRSRFLMAGFTPYPLSPLVNATIKTLLESYCKNYKLEERDGALYLGWINRYLVTSSAWH
ncbi:DNA topoisomerase 2-associated protein pat1 [Ancistrocladus abbreviatus]